MGFNFEDLDVYRKAIDFVNNISLKQGYMNQPGYANLRHSLTNLSKMLSGLKRSISQ